MTGEDDSSFEYITSLLHPDKNNILLLRQHYSLTNACNGTRITGCSALFV